MTTIAQPKPLPFTRGWCNACGSSFSGVTVCPSCATKLTEALYVGYCRPCRKYFEEEAAHPDLCPVCQATAMLKFEFTKELELEYGKLLLAVMPVFDKEIEPVLFDERVDAAKKWSSPTNPMFRAMATNQDLRRAIRLLRGVAAQHGLLAGMQGPEDGQEVVISYDGQPWVAWEDKRGSLRRLRPVAAPIADELANVPGDWPGAKQYSCDVCSAGPFPSTQALVGHKRSAHRAGEAA